MKDRFIAAEIIEPYAQALMALAQSHDLADQVGENVALVLELLESSDELSQFLANPLLKTDLKKSVLRQVAGDRLHPYMANFLMLLVDRGRITFLDGICRQYQTLLRQLRGTVLAEVTSAAELTEEQQQSVRQKVVAMTGAQNVDLQIKLDPDLIGGVIIKVGSQVVDASLRGQLRRIGLKLASAS